MILDTIEPNISIPLTIVGNESLIGPRLGGSPPVGISSPSGRLRYFLTVPVDNETGIDVSLFIDYNPSFSERRKLIIGNSPWLEIVTHPSVSRDTSRLSEAMFGPNKFVLGEAQSDVDDDELDSGNKIGGRAYLMNPRQSILDSITGLEGNGGRHFLQLEFPTDDQADVDIDWPFGDSLFNLYLESNSNGYRWSYIWQA